MPVVLRLLVLFFGLFALTVSGEAGATTGEKQIGTACADGANSADFDTLAQCSATSGSGTFQRAPVILGAVTAPPYTATTCNADKAGMLQYTGGVVQYCNSSAWGTLLTSTSTIGSGVYLGASAAATNPQRSGEVNTGLFSPATGVVAVSSLGAEALRVTSTGSVGIGTTTPAQELGVAGDIVASGNLGLGGAAVSSAYGINLTGTSTDASQRGLNLSLLVEGTLTADRTNYGIYNLVTSTASNVSYANTLYGDYNLVSNSAGTGYNTAYGSYNRITNNDTSLTNATSVGSIGYVANAAAGTLTTTYGVQGYTLNNSTGTITNAVGVYGYAQNASTGTIATAYGNYGYVRNTATGTIDTAYGGKNYVLNDAYGAVATAYGSHSQVRNDEGTTTTAYGNYSWVQQATATGSIDTSYGYYSRLDRDAGTMGTGYLYYGVFEGTHTTKYGIYLSGETSNYLSGRLGIGTDSPEDVLDVVGTRWIVGSSRADATIKYWRPALYNYNNADGTFVPFFAYSNSSNNGLTIGGGTSTGNAATVLYFNTAANQTTTSGTTRMIITSTGSVGIGTTTPSVSLYVNATDAVRIPAGTSAQRPTGAVGMIRYNSTLAAYEGYTSAWNSFVDSGALTTDVILGASTAAANPHRSGEVNTGLFSPATGVVAVSTLGTEALRITATNSVGIGTSTPAYKVQIAETSTTVGSRGLHVAHSGAISGTGYAGVFSKTGASTTNVGLHTSASGATNNYGLLVASGDVGIGTTTPEQALDVAGAVQLSSNLMMANGAILRAKNSSGTYENVFWPRFTNDATYLNYGDGGFYIRNNSSTTTLYLSATNSVGIGNAPAVSLDLAGKTDAVRIPAGTSAQRPTGAVGMIRYNSTTAAYEGYTTAWTGFVDSGSLSTDVLLGTSTAATNPHRSGDATTGLYSPAASTVGIVTAGTEALRVTATNSVGIGTTAPAQLLHVNGIAQATNFRVASGNGNGIGLWGGAPTSYGIFMSNDATYQYGGVTDYYIANLMVGGTSRGFVWSYGSIPSMALNASTGNLQVLGTFISEGTGASSFAGKLGIGVTPSYKLQVSDADTTANTRAVHVTQTGAVSGIGYAGVFTKTGASTTNVGLYATATGATNNYGLIVNQGDVGIGTTSPTVSLHVNRTDAIRIPVGTTAQRPTAATGQIRYNSTLSQFEGYNGSAWVALGGGTGYEKITSSCIPLVTAGASSSCTATCSSGKKIVGGSASCTASYAYSINSQGISGDAYTISCKNNYTSAQYITMSAVATCIYE